MTDETTETTSEDSADSILNQSPGVDWALAQIVAFAEIGVEIDITLTVGGRLLTGTVVGGRKYFEELGETFTDAKSRDGGDSDWNQILSTAFSNFREIYPPAADVKFDEVKPSYIHLIRARSLDGADFVPKNGTPWRIKLTSVDGFTIGSLTAS